MTDETHDYVALTADIAAAFVANNSISSEDVAGLIGSIHSALVATGAPLVVETEKKEPAVAIRSSVKHDYIVCLEDGAKLKMLKRYLRTRYDMSPEDYRAKWNLPRDYPMVAPAYAEQRRGLAKQIGLGRKKAESDTSASPAKSPKVAKAKTGPTSDTTPAKRGRKPKADVAPGDASDA